MVAGTFPKSSAASPCASLGGSVAVIQNAEENLHAVAAILAASGVGSAWLGINDQAREGVFVADGTSTVASFFMGVFGSLLISHFIYAVWQYILYIGFYDESAALPSTASL